MLHEGPLGLGIDYKDARKNPASIDKLKPLVQIGAFDNNLSDLQQSF